MIQIILLVLQLTFSHGSMPSALPGDMVYYPYEFEPLEL